MSLADYVEAEGLHAVALLKIDAEGAEGAGCRRSPLRGRLPAFGLLPALDRAYITTRFKYWGAAKRRTRRALTRSPA